MNRIRLHRQPGYWTLHIRPSRWYLNLARERKSPNRVKYGLHLGQTNRFGGFWADVTLGPTSRPHA